MSKKKKKSKFGTPIQKPPVPVGPQHNAQEKKDHNQSSSPIASDIHPAPNTPDKSQPSGKNAIPWWKMLECIGIFAGIGYAIISFCMWRAMLNTNRLTHDALVRSNRPWLAVDGNPQVLEPVHVGADGLQCKVRFSIKNFGVSPALYVNLRPSLDTFVFGGDEPVAQFKQSADSDCQTADLKTRPSVPGEGGTGPYIVPTGLLQRDIDVSNPSIKDFTKPFRVIGCIAYWDQFKERIHHSTFCFITENSAKDAGPNTRFSICPINQTAD